MWQTVVFSVARFLLGRLVTPALVREAIDFVFANADKFVAKTGTTVDDKVLAEIEAKVNRDALATTLADWFEGKLA